MTDDRVREAAKALIEFIREYKPSVENKYFAGNTLVSSHQPFKDLEDSLKPTREECADWLGTLTYNEEMQKMLDLAIEYLREDKA